MRFQFKILLLISLLTLLVTGISGLAFNYTLSKALYREIGEQALATARMTASDARVRSVLANAHTRVDTKGHTQRDDDTNNTAISPDPNTELSRNSTSDTGSITGAIDSPETVYKLLDPVIRPMKESSGASFITVADRNAIRVWHVSPDRIGDPMLHENNQEVLAGGTLLTESIGSLGRSLRGKVPVFSPDGQEIVGLVSAGFLDVRVEDVQNDYTPFVVGLSLAALLLGFVGSIVISRHLYRSLHGLEPTEIGRLYSEKQAILESVEEGIVSIDNEGRVTLLNAKAARLLGYADHLGLSEPSSKESKKLDTIEQLFVDIEMENEKGARVEQMLNGHRLLVRQVALRDFAGNNIGKVASLHDRTELLGMMDRLDEATEYAETQRIMTHEYNNRLYLISGLIQLECYDEAAQYIARESGVLDEASISSNIPESVMISLLVTKKRQASQMGVRMLLQVQGAFDHKVDWALPAETMGHLIDNAMEAAVRASVAPAVSVTLEEQPDGISLIVQDNGSGLEEVELERVFTRGYTSKHDQGHGYGLARVKDNIQQLGATLRVQSLSNGYRGCRFVIWLPSNSPAQGQHKE